MCASSFVARLAPDGRSLRWATLFDGGFGTWIQDLAVDAAGDVAMVGSTTRADFPTTLGALGTAGRTTPGGQEDGFAAKLDTGGGRLEWSGRFGGSRDDDARAVAVAAGGEIVVAGQTWSDGFPTTPDAAQRTCDGRGRPLNDNCRSDGFVMRIPAAGAEPAYSSYLGGAYDERVDALALDPDGRPLIAGATASDDFPAATDLTDGARMRTFVARLPAAGGAPEWSSLVGFNEGSATSVAPAPSGDVYLAGSAYMPLSVPAVDAVDAVQGAPGGGGDGWVMRVAAGRGSHRWSTWLGSAGNDWIGGLATVPGGLVAAGTTDSLDLPTRAAPDTALGDGACRDPRWCPADAFVSRLSEAATRAAYDDFAQRRRLTSIAGYAYTDSTAASREAGEPAHAGAAGGRSLWFEWTAPITRTVAFDTADSGIDTVLAVYSGNALGALTPVAANDDAEGRTTSRAVFTARQGRTYKIAVDGKGGAGGLVRLGWEGAPPHNDDFLDAQRITGEAGEVGGSMLYATAEEDEPLGSYGDPLESIWYRWTAPSTGVYVFSSADSPVATGLDVYRGERVELLEARSSVLEAKAGLTYSIRLYPLNRITGDTGDGVLRWHRAPRPANDDLANAQAITTASGSVTGKTYAATAERGEPAPDYGHTVWFAFAPPAGTYELSLVGPYFEDDDLRVYDGTGFGDFEPVAWERETVRIGVEAGDRVLVSFDLFGPYELSWKPVDAAANDLFSRARAQPTEGDEVVAVGGATTQPGESPGQDGVWFTWTAPAAGPVIFDVSEQGGGGLSVFTGSAIRALTPVGSTTYDRSFVSWTAAAGVTYRVRLGPYDGPRRSLIWAFGRPANDDFAAARQLTGAGGSVTFSAALATEQAGEPDTHGTGTTWFNWTAPSSGQATFTTVDSGTWLGLDVFVGSQLSSLAWVIQGTYDQNGYTATFPVTRRHDLPDPHERRRPRDVEADLEPGAGRDRGADRRHPLAAARRVRARPAQRQRARLRPPRGQPGGLLRRRHQGRQLRAARLRTGERVRGHARAPRGPHPAHGRRRRPVRQHRHLATRRRDRRQHRAADHDRVRAAREHGVAHRDVRLRRKRAGRRAPVPARPRAVVRVRWAADHRAAAGRPAHARRAHPGPRGQHRPHTGQAHVDRGRRRARAGAAADPLADPELPPDPSPTPTATPTATQDASPGTSSATGGPPAGTGGTPTSSGPLTTVSSSPGGDLQLSVTLTRTRLTPAALRRGLRVASGCSCACTISGKLVLVHRGTRTIARASAKGRAGRTVTLRLRVPARHLKALRRKGAVVRLLVTARSDGETATVRRKLSVRR